MPIGKNALKRVTNNGYSALNSSAPDMENSEIIEAKTEPKAEPKKPAAKKPATKKAEPKCEAKTEAKKPVAKPATKKSTAQKTEKPKAQEPKVEKTEELTHPDGFIKISFGMDMPTYLL